MAVTAIASSSSRAPTHAPGAAVIATYGLTHVALNVRDLDRTFAFYHAVFGAVEVYRGDDFLQLQTPGTRDVLVFERAARPRGQGGGVKHLGFRLVRARDIDAAADAVRASGGRVIEQGEFVPGEPYLLARDPDGYVLEIWFEIPTPVDPPGRPRATRRPPARRRRM